VAVQARASDTIHTQRVPHEFRAPALLLSALSVSVFSSSHDWA